MNLKRLSLLALAVALLPLAAPAVAQEMPERPPILYQIERAIDDNGAVPHEVARRFELPPMEIPLHNGTEKASRYAPGPIASVASGNGAATGSAIVAPAGGSFVTPRMTADRAIRRVIARID